MKSLPCSKSVCYDDHTPMKINPPTCNIVPFQPELRPVLPTIEGNVDYQEFCWQLERVEEILIQGGIERKFVEMSLNRWLKGRKKEPSGKQMGNFQLHSMRALRCNIARTLLGEDFRGMSCRIADSPLLQGFCLIQRLDVIRVPSKSTVERYSKWMSSEEMEEINGDLLRAGCGLKGEEDLGLKKPLDVEEYFLDSSCVKANIHFPVDWVILRDATRTLMKAVKVIRKHGLKHRMSDPQGFMKQMNILSIRMTHARRKKEGRKERKRVLRWMKQLVGVVASHARRYRKLLDDRWEETDLSRGQAEQVLRRMDGVLEVLPQASKQAHERIIGERRVENKDKLLSLYEREIRVIVRGKSGAEVEFGNTLLLGEQANGVIVDWQLMEEQAPSDSKLVVESIQRVQQALKEEKIGACVTDRGFESKPNVEWLEKMKIFNALCPRNPKGLKKRFKESRFRRLQARRAQTEGRIAIFKNEFLGKPMRSKGFGHRKIQIAWGVLTHNLWVIARLPTVAEEEFLEKVA
jgi:hypothetical protein